MVTFSAFFLLPCSMLFSDGRRPFIYPVDGAIVIGFRQEYYDWERSSSFRHTGIDIEGAPGEKVTASGNGVISFTGFTPTGGLTVVIRHNPAIRTTYLNLGAVYVTRGDEVIQGQVIAALGASDDPSHKGCHLHFGVIHQGVYLDPEQLLSLDYSDISRFLSLTYVRREPVIY